MSEYISRSKLKAHYSWLGKCTTLSPKDLDDIIDAQPAADVEPVMRGEWVFTEDLENHLWYECSACKTEYNLKYMHKRCPNCGAHMERSGTIENT